MSRTITNDQKSFSSVENRVGNGNTNNGGKSLYWYPAKRIQISLEQMAKEFNERDFDVSEVIYDTTLKLIRTNKLGDNDWENNNLKDVIQSEEKHSVIIPAKYEGGLKLWDCNYYLGKYLLGEKIDMKNKSVLDLGCGFGVLGIFALLRGASRVHFQDYNVEVIKSVTIPNVILNVSDKKLAQEKCEFFCGDWESFAKLSQEIRNNDDKEYDLILTSATIYSAANYKKLHHVFENKLKNNGTVYVAGKVCYPAYDGRMRDFENFVQTKNVFDTKVVWRSENGILREILKLNFLKRDNRDH